ncbi:MAG: methyl-accepting chemotaxis protein, partial [Polaromonas sp.]|nr:methyl-accepting chemotaxis protein [Polaromonas sp.]MDP3247066.1 methyl-accepting chemotaxis protein [Polaromonas sp.]MDP3754855.1 methyl-accepting chemotaxis protein [Polaromonas sp.]
QEQASGLSQVVSVFRLGGEQVHHQNHQAPARSASPKARPMQPPKARQAIAAPRKPAAPAGELATAGGSWETF